MTCPNCASWPNGWSRSTPTSNAWSSTPTDRSRSCSDSVPWENGSARWRSNSGGWKHLAPRISAAEQQVGKLTGTYDRLASGLAETAEGIEQVSGQAQSIEETVAATLRLKEELSGFLAMQQPFREMRREMDELQAQSQNFRNDMARVRSEHETTVAGYRRRPRAWRLSRATGSVSPAPSARPSTVSPAWSNCWAISLR